MKYRVLWIAALLTALLLPGLSLSAAAGTGISVGTQSRTIGETVAVTVTLTADEAIYAVEGWLAYDPALLRFESGSSCREQDGTVHFVTAVSGSLQVTLTVTFTAIAAGDCELRLYDVCYVGSSGQLQKLNNSTAALRLTADVNGDGCLNAADLTDLRKRLMGVTEPDAARSDLNGDGAVDIKDMIRLKRLLSE